MEAKTKRVGRFAAPTPGVKIMPGKIGSMDFD